MSEQEEKNIVLACPAIGILSDKGCIPVFIAGVKPGRQKGNLTFVSVDPSFTVDDIFEACKMFVSGYNKGEFKQS